MVAQITLRWSGVPNSPGGVWLAHAASVADAVTLGNAIPSAFGAGMGGYFIDSATISWDGEVREYNSATGVLIGAATSSPETASYGTATDDPVANATQVLMRWGTGAVVSGRRLRGRTYVPGLHKSALAGGELLAAAQTAIQTTVDEIVALGLLHIWHRPVNGGGGQDRPVTGGSVWNELAVIRNRRN